MPSRWTRKAVGRALSAYRAYSGDHDAGSSVGMRAALDAAEQTDGLPELAGVSEAAEILGVHGSNVHRDINRADSPVKVKPVQSLRSGSIWRADDLRELAKHQTRRKRS